MILHFTGAQFTFCKWNEKNKIIYTNKHNILHRKI